MPLKKIHPWQIFTPEKYSHKKNIHPKKIFTPQKYSSLKSIYPWELVATEEYSLLKNIHTWKIFIISPSSSHRHHITITISPSPSRCHHLAVALCHHSLTSTAAWKKIICQKTRMSLRVGRRRRCHHGDGRTDRRTNKQVKIELLSQWTLWDWVSQFQNGFSISNTTLQWQWQSQSQSYYYLWHHSRLDKTTANCYEQKLIPLNWSTSR